MCFINLGKQTKVQDWNGLVNSRCFWLRKYMIQELIRIYLATYHPHVEIIITELGLHVYENTLIQRYKHI